MKYFSIILISACLSVGIVSCQKDPANKNSNIPGNTPDTPVDPPPAQGPVEIPETQSPIQTPVSVMVNANCGGFYQALPARYDSTTKRYPLMVFIHGIGELGNGTTNLSKVLANAVPSRINSKKFPPKFTVNNKDFSFIVVSPQFKAWPSNADVDAVVKYSIAHLRIDTTRIYVAGLSMGGGATLEYAVSNGKKIAAIVTMAGASYPTATKAKAIAAANLPLWAFHNADDGTAPVSYTNDYVSLINAEKPAVLAKKTIWPTGGHDSWTKASDPAYRENGMNMYEWMLQYTR